MDIMAVVPDASIGRRGIPCFDEGGADESDL